MHKTVLILIVITTNIHLFSCKGLEKVHVLFRHGNRTPEQIILYPTDPHFNVSYQDGFGHLTYEGRAKLRALGETLKQRYYNFLNYSSIEAQSTDYNRTQESLNLVLESLGSPKLRSVFPVQEDHILGQPYRNCPKYRQLYLDYLNSEDGRQMFENYTSTLDYIAGNSGLNVSSKNVFELYCTLQMELENGLTLPAWTEKVFPDVLTELAYLEYEARSATRKLKRLSSGFLLNKIINDTKSKNSTMFLYSGHEFNITYLMQLLGIYYPHMPPYGAYILIEIHNIKGKKKVKLLYQDYTRSSPRRLKLPKCKKLCSFERFEKLYKKYLPESPTECNI